MRWKLLGTFSLADNRCLGRAVAIAVVGVVSWRLSYRERAMWTQALRRDALMPWWWWKHSLFMYDANEWVFGQYNLYTIHSIVDDMTLCLCMCGECVVTNRKTCSTASWWWRHSQELTSDVRASLVSVHTCLCVCLCSRLDWRNFPLTN